MKECEICGRWQHTHRHHLIYGTGYRQLSEKYDLVINVCPQCHDKIHRGGLGLWSKQEGQRRFIAKYSKEKYMEVFGRNWNVQ